MPNVKYDWERIIRDMTDIIAGRIAAGKKPPTITSLYKQLSKQYKESGQPFPVKSEIFTRKIHQYLGLDKNSKNYEPYFYRLAGQYSSMTLDSLATGLSVSSVSADSSNWIFIRLKSLITDSKAINSYSVVQKHLYLLSQKLKEKFSSEIIFISFDRDTLVILCRDNASNQKVVKYFSRINGTEVL